MSECFLFWTNLPGSERSASAGAFYYIADKFFQINNDGVVYGCILKDDATVIHRPVYKREDLFKLQGSKYVQSNMAGCFEEIENLLSQKRSVLFSGTPCQNAALRGYLQKNYDNLLLVDIVCHGVPSPKLFRLYMNYLERIYGGKILNLRFRNKSLTNRLGYILEFDVNGKHIKRFADEDAYYRAFLNAESIRPSCYNCPFVTNRPGDLSIGDSNSKKIHPYEAISFVMMNSDKGSLLKKLIEDDIKSGVVSILPTTLDEEADSNHQLRMASRIPAERIYSNILNNDFDGLHLKKRHVQHIKNLVKDIFPTRMKDWVKDLRK